MALTCSLFRESQKEEPMRLFIVTTATLAMTLTACDRGGGSTTPAPAKLTQLSYHFVVNGCDTEEHAFTGLEAQDALQQLCDGLQDENANHSCARSERHEMFDVNNCSGGLNPIFKSPPATQPT